MSIFDLTGVKRPNIEGYLWVNILVKFDLNGNSEIVRSFTKPAKDSYIKKSVKPKTEKPKSLNFSKEESNQEEDLFSN